MATIRLTTDILDGLDGIVDSWRQTSFDPAAFQFDTDEKHEARDQEEQRGRAALWLENFIAKERTKRE